MAPLTGQLAADLLQKYEPVLCFDSANNVLPMDTAPYVRHCSLWQAPRASLSFGKPKMLKGRGQITRRDLGEMQYDANSVYYLRFAELDDATAQAMKRQGITVTTEHIIKAALAKYNALPQADRAPAYHGRAFNSGRYTVLQYWFFYPVNDFKTSHGGINDHEGDWEGLSLFLPRVDRTAADEPPVAAATHPAEDRWWQPLALLAAAHNDSAARDWPDVEKEGEHPRCYVARGSHATYYHPGQHSVDRADGRGIIVGPGAGRPWQRVILPVDPLPNWVTRYNGAWGYFSRDALGGFNGPGGLTHTLKFHLFKGFYHAPRTTWTDPVGTAGLA
ncbi:MAG: hypothetical protein ACE5G8_11495 [Anaerolineae bacterium]